MLHLLVALGQHNHQRALAVSGQAIALVGRCVFRLIEQSVFRQNGAQAAQQALQALCSVNGRCVGRHDGADAKDRASVGRLAWL